MLTLPCGMTFGEGSTLERLDVHDLILPMSPRGYVYRRAGLTFSVRC